jgi:hypothetical protein
MPLKKAEHEGGLIGGLLLVRIFTPRIDHPNHRANTLAVVGHKIALANATPRHDLILAAIAVIALALGACALVTSGFRNSRSEQQERAN